MESTAVWNLKPDWWGSHLVQAKYRGKKVCDNNDNKIIIIIIIIIIKSLFVNFKYFLPCRPISYIVHFLGILL